MSTDDAFSADGVACGEALVALLGPHPCHQLGIDLASGDDATLGEWLIAACLLGSRASEAQALAAFAHLREHGLAAQARVASASPLSLLSALEPAGIPRPEAVVALLQRLARSLSKENDASSLAALAATCLSLEELGTRLARLAPGFGRATVARFLRPLRGIWPIAAELPLEPAAEAAAVHLGLIEAEMEPDAALARLARSIGTRADSPVLRDVEAALERLGRAACRRDRTERCPLGDACPRRGAGA